MDEAKYSDRLGGRPDDIVIVGYAFRLPQNVDDDFTFWDVLQKRRNLRTDWPASRINADAFKAKEAAAMDPMQRWTLEISYRAFENAGMPAGSLRGSRTAVFSASMLEDYARMTAMDLDNTERTAVTGSTVACVIPNRASWYFDLRGPCIHVNTACSSALSAVDMACKSLQAGDSSCALVTGANLLLDPGVFQVLSSGGFLSPDGVCHSLDHRANGYARGEGFIALVLKPIAAAVRDGDMIRAVIRAVGSNQDGNTPVLTQPSAEAQEDLIRHVYARAGLPFDQTHYVEAHGTGTRVGDPIEVRAIGRVFGDFRSAEEPMFVGSVKANVGHLEGASALASIVKAIFILEKGIIPGQALLEKLKPNIDADIHHIAIPLRDTVWPSPGLRRISVNSFGFGERGLHGHHCTVPDPLVSNADAQARNLNGVATRLPKLLVWSAADEGALNRMIQAYESYYKDRIAGDLMQLDRLAFTLAARRSRMLWRAFSIVNNGAETESLPRSSKPTRSSAEVAMTFVFTGQGAQYAHMGHGLCRYSVFRQTLEQVDGIYRSLGAEWSLFDELRSSENIDKPEYSQPLTTTVQVALVELLTSFGVVPKAVVYAIGALSLASACRVAFFRGLLAGKLRATSARTPQAMMSVNLAEDQVPNYLSKIGMPKASAVSSVCVACVNSPLNCTLSGPEAAIDAIKAQADRDGIFAQKLRTGVAYHSPSMHAIASEYLTLMGHLKGGTASKVSGGITMVSSVAGKEVRPAELAKPQYWVGNMVSTVRFADAVRALLAEFESRITDFVEVGPHPALRRPVRDSIGKEQQIRYAGVLERSRPAMETMLELVGGLFSLGHAVSIPAVNYQQAKPAPRPLVDCPSYPFDHSHRYWAESRLSRDLRLRGTVQGGTLGVRVSDWNPLAPRWRNFLSVESSPWFGHHKISDTVVYPAAAMLIMAIEAVQQQTARTDRTVAGYQLEQAEFLNPIIVLEAWEDRAETQVHLQPARKKENSFDVSIFSYSHSRQWSECFHARITVEYQGEHEEEHKQAADEGARARQAEAQRRCRLPLDSEVFYHDAAEHGLHYGDWFQLLREMHWDGLRTAVARVDMSRQRYRSDSLVHPALLDTAFHVLRASAGQQPAANVPQWRTQLVGHFNRAIREKPDDLGEDGTLQALAADGTVLYTIKTAVTAPVSGTAEAEKEDKEKKLLYSMEWKPQLSLLEPQQLAGMCHAHVSARDETAIVSNHASMCAALDLVANHLLRHVDWMKHHVATLPSARRQEGGTINDADLETRLRQVEEVLPAWKLYTACAQQLGSILAGEADPLQVVFESELANVFYANLFLNLCADGRLAAFLELAPHENPTMRILEVGAGTGGMTGHVLNALQAREARTGAPSFAKYTYTNISPVLFERARNRCPDLHQQGRMTFQALDLDRSVETQGLKAGSYDMIIAASVLHATPYLEPTLRNVRTALKPGGRLVLVEVINPADVATNFMAGLVPGSWVAREEWRPHSAAITESMWDKLLRANGFSGNDMLLRDYESEECHIMSVTVSTAREAAKMQNAPSEQQTQLARLVGSLLGPGCQTPTVCPFSSDEVPCTLAGVADDDAVICLVEVRNRPLLANLSEHSYALLWATAPSAADDPLAAHYGVAQGFLRCIRAEQSSSRLVSVAIDDCSNDATCADFIAKAFRAAFEPSPSGVALKEVEYVVRHGLLTTGRAVENLLPFVQDLTHDPGTVIGPDEAEMEAKAWSLSQDNLDSVAAKRISDGDYLGTDELQLMPQSGTGCAGIITRVGRNLDKSLVRPGDRVCMLLPPGEDMRKYMRAHHMALTKLPPAGNLSFEVCAASLVPAMTAYHALIDVARLKPGMSVLIHHASGATAQMAVRIARAHGASRVLATASSPGEKQFLVDTLGLPAEDILLSGPATAFASGVRAATQGAGVDVVFNNAFIGDDALLASCECLARGGCFVETGRANLESGTALPMSVFAKNITLSAAHLSDLSGDAAAGLAGRPLRVFDVSQAHEAAKHVKTSQIAAECVVIRPRDQDMVSYLVKEERQWMLDHQGSYLIAGGSGGLGRAIVRWMADRGAKHIIIASRSGATSGAARELLAELGARGVNVVAMQCDVSSESSLAGMLKECTRRGMPSIRGCINAAMVLQDAIFQDSMAFSQWDLTMRSKVQSSYNLHRLLPQDLDFFILLSSLAGVVGQMGSANYAAGCSFQDALARHRLARGQRAVSLDVGWMKNIGIIAETTTYQRQRQRAEDMQPIDASELLALLTLALDPATPVPIPVHAQLGQLLFGLRTPADLLAQGRAVPALLERPLFAAFSYNRTAVKAESPSSSVVASSAPDDSVLFRQAAVGSRERSMIVRRALASKLVRAMLIAPEDVEPTKPLSAYGVDSLMAVELRNWFGKEFGTNVAVFEIMGGVPIANIAKRVAARSTLK
ncbi:polyketide synthase [Achaetomium macrosporum]|uniref:Polyketide synthase n=1 Tax=Achaetomium macrosporum TaxID=79813 RepID=A0AAN7C3W3_9PEZI|nr:polyketide synthase [Achaetomium macrosporum]